MFSRDRSGPGIELVFVELMRGAKKLFLFCSSETPLTKIDSPEAKKKTTTTYNP